MDGDVPGVRTSRRELLAFMAATPVVGATVTIVSPWQADLDKLQTRYDLAPLKLVRTHEARENSGFRYANAHRFFPDARKPFADTGCFLYHAGITAQLALSSHLLDVGFPDQWCARNIGLRVALSLAYANATGFGHDCPRMHKLSRVLTPYWKWNRSDQLRRGRKPNDGGFAPEEVRALLGALLKQVRLVTGHPHTPDMLLREEV